MKKIFLLFGLMQCSLANDIKTRVLTKFGICDRQKTLNTYIQLSPYQQKSFIADYQHKHVACLQDAECVVATCSFVLSLYFVYKMVATQNSLYCLPVVGCGIWHSMHVAERYHPRPMYKLYNWCTDFERTRSTMDNLCLSSAETIFTKLAKSK